MNKLSSYSFGWKIIFAVLVITFAIVRLIPSPGNGFDMFSKRANVGVIDVSGTISNSEGSFLSSRVTPEKIRTLTRKAENKNIDAILYSINSPGGSVVASKEIKRIIENSQVPTVCQYNDVAASGALWLSMGCDEIVSDSLSLTGSIGATSSYLEFSGLLEKLGVEYVNLTSGKFKSTGSPFKNITEEEKEHLQSNLNQVREVFVEEILESRDLERSELQNVTDGRTLLGKEAKEIGIVDHLGGRKTVEQVLKDKMDVEKVNFQKIQISEGFNLLSQILTKVGYGMGSAFTEKENKGLVSIKR